MLQAANRKLRTPARFGRWSAVSLLMLACVLSTAARAQSWTVEASLPTAREKLASCVIGNHIYAIGGTTAANEPGLNTNEGYDLQTGTWTTLQPMPSTRRELTASAVGGKCYVIGGSEGFQSAPLSVLEIYDPATNQWSGGASMPTARFYPVSAAIDGIIYVVGGAAGSGSIFNDLQAYDPSTNSWRILTPMPTPRAVSAATAFEGKLYVFGGTNAPFSQRFAVAEVYDPATDQWSGIANMPQPLAALSAQAAGGRIYLVGGSEPTQAGVTTVNVYDPGTDSWSATTPLPATLSLHATAFVDGDLYAIGGARSTQPPHPALNSVLSLEIPMSEPVQPINAGMADAWYNPATSGQGFFITVFPDIKIVFLAWFTYETARPDPGIEAMLGEPGHRWLTAQGPYENDVAILDVVMSSGGVFDSPTPPVTNDAEYGTMAIKWHDCENATLDYDLEVPDLQGTIELQRVAADRTALCEALSGN